MVEGDERKTMKLVNWIADSLRDLKATATLSVFAFACVGFATVAAHGQSSRYAYKGDLQFKIERVPFSRFGSYLSISDMSQFQSDHHRADGIFLRSLHSGGVESFQIELVKDSQPVATTARATPTLLTLSGGGGTVEICFDGQDRLRVHGSNVQLRLTAQEGMAVPYPEKRWELNTDATKYMLSPLQGRLEEAVRTSSSPDHGAVFTFESAASDGAFDAEIDVYESGWDGHAGVSTFEQVERREKAAYMDWLETMPRVNTDLGAGAELAAYVNWSSVVHPSGNLKRPAMLMSKNWMGSVWSWDQTFNAMATSMSNPALAWDQFMLPIDVQNATGAFPDKWDADSMVWTYSKPPVHGWALDWLMRHGNFGDEQHLREVYEPLERWTEWYFKYRDLNGNGLPEYRHGDESGWDNSTALIAGIPVESPDLSAHLVLQMEALAEIADRLGKLEESKRWKQRSSQLLDRLLKRFWTGHEFVAFRETDGEQIKSQSLLLLLPVILGHRLPSAVQQQLVDDLRSRLKTSPYGLPSEPPSSSLYLADGYWRGPIWAPTTMLIAEGLDDMGEHELAHALRKKFCLMAQQSGMAENFDALSGTALRDPAYTWTSSVYLIFANQLANESNGTESSRR